MKYINDGTPYDGKLSRTVWSGGKLGDNIKELPITIACFPFYRAGSHQRKGSEQEWEEFANAYYR